MKEDFPIKVLVWARRARWKSELLFMITLLYASKTTTNFAYDYLWVPIVTGYDVHNALNLLRRDMSSVLF